jgi:kynurenine 3-monooxygenase
VDLGAGRATVFNADTKEEEPVECGPVIGADGAFSAVRHSMMMRSDRFEYAQSYLTHGYKELTIPPAEGGGHRLEKHALHIWPRGAYMLIALPNADGSFTATLFLPYAGTHGDASRPGFDDLITRQRVLDFFERTFRDALAQMPTLGEDFFTHPTGSLVTVRCSPWRDGERALLIGDAAHAVLPFYGQGMNAAFEDCRTLAELLARTPKDLAHAFGAFERQRKPSADALADLALHNFVEMRDLAGKRWFRWRKRLERTLARLFPRAFMPLYTMVTFTNIPYEQAVARARAQDRAVLTLFVAVVVGAVLLVTSLLARALG